MQPLNTTVSCRASSVIGWSASSLRSMIASRRWPSATQPSSDHSPAPSGPRSPIASAIRAAAPTSARAPPKAISPAIPHICSRPLSFSATRHDAGPEPPQQGGLVLVDASHEGPHAVVLRPHGVRPAAAQTGRPLPGRPHLLVGLLVAVLAVLLHVLVRLKHEEHLSSRWRGRLHPGTGATTPSGGCGSELPPSRASNHAMPRGAVVWPPSR